MRFTYTTCQKHLGLYLDEKLSFSGRANANISKGNKGIGIIKRLLNTLPRKSLLNVFKSFIRLHLHYCDINYNQLNNESFCAKIERIQYNLAITDAIKETPHTKLHKDQLESLKFRRWFRQLCDFFKVKTNEKPDQLDPNSSAFLESQSLDQIDSYYCRTDTFKSSSVQNSWVEQIWSLRSKI